MFVLGEYVFLLDVCRCGFESHSWHHCDTFVKIEQYLITERYLAKVIPYPLDINSQYGEGHIVD